MSPALVIAPEPAPIPQQIAWVFNEGMLEAAANQLAAAVIADGRSAEQATHLTQIVITFLYSPHAAKLRVGAPERAVVASTPLPNPLPQGEREKSTAGHCDLCGSWDGDLHNGVGRCCARRWTVTP